MPDQAGRDGDPALRAPGRPPRHSRRHPGGGRVRHRAAWGFGGLRPPVPGPGPRPAATRLGACGDRRRAGRDSRRRHHQRRQQRRGPGRRVPDATSVRVTGLRADRSEGRILPADGPPDTGVVRRGPRAHLRGGAGRGRGADPAADRAPVPALPPRRPGRAAAAGGGGAASPAAPGLPAGLHPRPGRACCPSRSSRTPRAATGRVRSSSGSTTAPGGRPRGASCARRASGTPRPTSWPTRWRTSSCPAGSSTRSVTSRRSPTSTTCSRSRSPTRWGTWWPPRTTTGFSRPGSSPTRTATGPRWCSTRSGWSPRPRSWARPPRSSATPSTGSTPTRPWRSSPRTWPTRSPTRIPSWVWPAPGWCTTCSPTPAARTRRSRSRPWSPP